MQVLDSVFRFFEGWVDPFKPREDYEPPNRFLAYVWHYVSQVKWAFAALLAYGFANAIIEALVFSYVGELVDILTRFEAQGLLETGWNGLMQEFGSTLLFMLFVVAILRTLVVAFGALIEEQVIVPGFFTLMRWQSHKHVIGQSLSFFQNDLAGRISQKVFQSGVATGDMMISLLQVIWFVVIYAFTTAGLLFALDWQLGLVIAVWIVGFTLMASHYIPKVRDYSQRTSEAASVVSGRLVDSYSNVQTVKLQGNASEDAFVLQTIQNFQKTLFPFTRTLTKMRVSLVVMNSLVVSMISYLSIDLWLSGQSTLGSVAFVLALVLRLQLLSARLMSNLNGFFRNVGITQNTMGLVARPHDIRDVVDAPALHFEKGAIEFRNIHFHYGKDGGVIDGLNLKVKAAEKVGVVGPSGAGKTTLLNLLMRFYDPEQGQVLIDGQDIARVSQDSLRTHFSLVQQDVQLFHRSVFENIALGNPDVTLEEVKKFAKLANAHDFIVDLEDSKGNKGYDVQVGERGVKLSGGQRQRIAIARALFKDAPILVLDEATSQLDSGVEEAIQQNLETLMEGKTVFVVAHRLSTVAKLDRLIVMNRGKIVAQGRHEELIKEEGLYSKLWKTQSEIG